MANLALFFLFWVFGIVVLVAFFWCEGFVVGCFIFIFFFQDEGGM